MANVYTRKYKHPRTTTLLDFRNYDVILRPQLRVLSPTRCCVPHPVGLNHQNIPSTSTYLIWHPDLTRKTNKYKQMLRHIRNVNFSCDHPKKFDFIKKKDQLPTIKYTENTISRGSYVNPARFPDLKPQNPTSRFGNNLNRKAVTGIVPTLIVPEYLPVVDK